MLKDHLRQLVKVGYLKEFVADSRNRNVGQSAQQRGNPFLPPLEVIEVIHIAPRGAAVTRRKCVLVVVPIEDYSGKQPSEKKMKFTREPIAINDNDLEGKIQPHDDVLVVTARINGFIVKRVMIDLRSGADVMYLDPFKGLGLKDKDLSKYDMPLVRFDGQVVIPEGQISLPVKMEGKEVVVAFIVVVSFSPYTTILGRSWIHTMGTVLSTLHMKVKFHTEQGIVVVRGSQQVAKQCLVVAVNWKHKQARQKETFEEVPL